MSQVAQVIHRQGSGRHALTADYVDPIPGDAPEKDRNLAARPVLVRFHDVQHAAGGNRCIEGVAALLEYRHARGGGEPMRGGDDAEGTDYFWP